jgi:hypothetical protein
MKVVKVTTAEPIITIEISRSELKGFINSMAVSNPFGAALLEILRDADVMIPEIQSRE